VDPFAAGSATSEGGLKSDWGVLSIGHRGGSKGLQCVRRLVTAAGQKVGDATAAHKEA